MDDDDSLGNFKKLTLPQGGTQDKALWHSRPRGWQASITDNNLKEIPTSRRERVKGREVRVVLHIRPQLWFLKEVRGGVVIFFSAALHENLRKYFAYHSKLPKGFAFSSILRYLRGLQII